MNDYKIEIYDSLPSLLEKEIEELQYICFAKKDLTEDQRQINDDTYCSKADRFRYIIASSKGKPLAHIAL